MTSGSLWAMHAAAPDPACGVEVVVLVLANAIATLVRFLSVRQLMGRRSAADQLGP